VIGRVTASLASVFTVLVLCGPPAAAISPPMVDAQATPPPGNAGPAQPMIQRSPCLSTGVLPGSDVRAASPNLLSLKLVEAWQHSRGDGQTVAVIDTGVQPGPRLPNVEAGGELVV
jgi:membrane-anchored mycosin MYCP